MTNTYLIHVLRARSQIVGKSVKAKMSKANKRGNPTPKDESVTTSNKFELLSNDFETDFNLAKNTKNTEEMLSVVFSMVKEIYQEMKTMGKTMKELQEANAALNQANIALKGEVRTLKTNTTKIETELQQVKEEMNMQQQHSRNWCARVNGVSVPDEDVAKLGHINAVKKAVYDKVLSKIIQNDKVKMKIPSPYDKYWDVIENAHTLPTTKKDGFPPTIIVRFKERSVRNVILEHKSVKNIAGERVLESCVTRDDKIKGVSKYTITADLTKTNLQRITTLMNSGKFERIWHLDGRILKFFLKDQKNGKPYIAKMSDKSAEEIIKEAKKNRSA